MISRIVHTGLLALMCVPLAAQQPARSFLCIAEAATGFAFNESRKAWESTDFSVEKDRYVVRPVNKTDSEDLGLSPGDTYGVWKVGEKTAEFGCKQGASEFNWLSCGQGDNAFSLNVATLRYQIDFRGSYMTATLLVDRDAAGHLFRDADGNVVPGTKDDNGGDMPYIEIGKCSGLLLHVL